MNKLFLGGSNTFRVNDSASITGASGGTEVIKIIDAPNIQLDANIERIELSGNIADYTFKVDGTEITILKDGFAVATMSSLNQTSTLACADGSVDVQLTGIGQATVGGAAISSVASSVTPTTINTGDVSDVNNSTASGGTSKLFLESNTTFRVLDDVTLTGASGGNETVKIIGTPNISMDANVERVELPSNSSDYTYEITGTTITTLFNGVAVTTMSGLNQSVGLAFADGTATLELTGIGKATLGGTDISTTASTITPTTIDTSDVYSSTVSTVKSYSIAISSGANSDVTSGNPVVFEGNTVVFGVSSKNTSTGDTVDYTITGVSTSDINNMALTGTATMDSTGKASISVDVSSDGVTESAENLTIELVGGSSTSVSIYDPVEFSLF